MSTCMENFSLSKYTIDSIPLKEQGKSWLILDKCRIPVEKVRWDTSLIEVESSIIGNSSCDTNLNTTYYIVNSPLFYCNIIGLY